MKKKYLLIGLAGLMLLTACGKKEEGQEVKDQAELNQTLTEDLNQDEDVEVNNEMEDLDLSWFETMNTVDLDGNKIKETMFLEYDLTLVNVWNSECPPCIAELPELQKLAEKYTNIGVKGMPIEIAGFNVEVGLGDGEKKVVKDLLQGASANYQQILAWDELLEGGFFNYVEGFPTTFFLNNKGEVLNIYVGARNLDSWSELVEENLEEVANGQ